MSSVSPAASPSVPTTSGAHNSQFLPNLTAIINDKNSTAQQKSIATQQRNVREYTSFGRLEAGATVLGDYRAYYHAYLAYTNKLSPAERADPRYATVIPQVQAALDVATKSAAQKAQQPNANLSALFQSTQIKPLGPPQALGSQSPLPGVDMMTSLGQLNQLLIASKYGKSISRADLGLGDLTFGGAATAPKPTAPVAVPGSAAAASATSGSGVLV